MCNTMNVDYFMLKQCPKCGKKAVVMPGQPLKCDCGVKDTEIENINVDDIIKIGYTNKEWADWHYQKRNR